MANPIETALVDAISKAAAAGEWAIVAQLAIELEARRVRAPGGNVTPIDRARGKR